LKIQPIATFETIEFGTISLFKARVARGYFVRGLPEDCAITIRELNDYDYKLFLKIKSNDTWSVVASLDSSWNPMPTFIEMVDIFLERMRNESTK
jgi:hypothetical protein